MGRDVAGLRIDKKPSPINVNSNGTVHTTVHVAPKATPEEEETRNHEKEEHATNPEEQNEKKDVLKSTNHEPEEKIIRAETPRTIARKFGSPIKRASVSTVNGSGGNLFEPVENQTISTDHANTGESKDSGLKSLAISDDPVSPLTVKEPVSPLPIKEPVSPLPVKELVSPSPVKEPVSPLPVKQHVSPLPVKEPVSPLPVKQPVSPLPLKQPVSPLPVKEPVPLPVKEPVAPVTEKEPEPISPPMSSKQPESNEKKYSNEEDNWSLASSTATSRTSKFRVTVPVAPRFTCADRLERRKQFYTKLEEKHRALEKERLEYEARTKEEEESAIRQLRKSMVVKAKPVPSFYREGPPPKPELKKLPVTRAKSPNLTRRKSFGDAAKSSPDDKAHSARMARHSVGVYKESKSSPIAPKSRDRTGVRKLNGTSRGKDHPQLAKDTTTDNPQVKDQGVENSQVSDQGVDNAVES